MNILITGATGFIGSNLVKQLSRINDVKITALTRRKVVINNVNVKTVDLCNKNELDTVFRENKFDLVYHIAGFRGISKIEFEEYYKSNILPTKIISELCLKYKIKFVYISSIGVHGTIPKNLPCDENSELVPDCNYHLSKILAEKEILHLISSGLNAIIIRPTITYGPEDYGFIYKIIRLIDLNFPFFPKETIIHLLSVYNLINLLISLKDIDFNRVIEESGGYPAFIVADKKPIFFGDLVAIIQKNLNKKSIKLGNKKVLNKISFFKWIKLSGISLKLDLISKDWFYSIDKAQMILNYYPKETDDEIIKTIKWYNEKKGKKGN